MQKLTFARIMTNGELVIAKTLHKRRFSIVDRLGDELKRVLAATCVIENVE